jgi:hypothetical protein
VLEAAGVDGVELVVLVLLVCPKAAALPHARIAVRNRAVVFIDLSLCNAAVSDDGPGPKDEG